MNGEGVIQKFKQALFCKPVHKGERGVGSGGIKVNPKIAHMVYESFVKITKYTVTLLTYYMNF